MLASLTFFQVATAVAARTLCPVHAQAQAHHAVLACMRPSLCWLQEDAHAVALDIDGHGTALFGIFDGHAGVLHEGTSSKQDIILKIFILEISSGARVSTQALCILVSILLSLTVKPGNDNR